MTRLHKFCTQNVLHQRPSIHLPPLIIRRQSTTPPSSEFPLNLRYLPPRDLLVDVYIGKPPRKFTLLVDTGSTDIWIRHESLKSISGNSGATFLPSKSATWQQSRAHWRVKYSDNTIIEGVEGIEKVQLDGVSFDARVGVAQRIWTEDGTVAPGRIVGVKAGRKGYESIDGILGIGLGSSSMNGLRSARIRGIKLEFKRGKEGKNAMKLIQDTDKEEGVVWYPSKPTSGASAWEIGLSRISHGKIQCPAPRNEKMVVDTGCIHVYLHPWTAGLIFSHPTLERYYSQVHFAPNHSTASEHSESGWHLNFSPGPSEPMLLEFAGSRIKWPISLASPMKDQYASIRGAGDGGRSILGMAFLSQLKGVIFDFTKGNERIGLINRHEIPQEKFGERTKDRVIQLVVGASLGLGSIVGWKWYEGTLFSN